MYCNANCNTNYCITAGEKQSALSKVGLIVEVCPLDARTDEVYICIPLGKADFMCYFLKQSRGGVSLHGHPPPPLSRKPLIIPWCMTTKQTVCDVHHETANS